MARKPRYCRRRRHRKRDSCISVSWLVLHFYFNRISSWPSVPTAITKPGCSVEEEMSDSLLEFDA